MSNPDQGSNVTWHWLALPEDEAVLELWASDAATQLDVAGPDDLATLIATSARAALTADADTGWLLLDIGYAEPVILGSASLSVIANPTHLEPAELLDSLRQGSGSVLERTAGPVNTPRGGATRLWTRWAGLVDDAGQAVVAEQFDLIWSDQTTGNAIALSTSSPDPRLSPTISDAHYVLAASLTR